MWFLADITVLSFKNNTLFCLFKENKSTVVLLSPLIEREAVFQWFTINLLVKDPSYVHIQLEKGMG